MVATRALSVSVCALSALLVAWCPAAAGAAAAGLTVEDISPECVGCLCAASTGCDLSVGCSADGNVCGPFAITELYFIDANVTQEADFSDVSRQSCCNDPFCAALAVRRYMVRYSRDCDGDGAVTCVDFALMHRLGFQSCRRNLGPGQRCLLQEGSATECLPEDSDSAVYWRRFQECWTAYAGP